MAELLIHTFDRASELAEIEGYRGFLGDLKSQRDLHFSRGIQHDQKIVFRSITERVEYLRLIEVATELQLLRHSVRDRLGVDPQDCLTSAEAMIRRGLRLASKIRESDRGSEPKEALTANWCEGRLLMHLSVVRTRRAAHPGNVEPLGLLADAEAKLRMANPHKVRAEYALIDLHRAEEKLQSANLRELTTTLRDLEKGDRFEELAKDRALVVLSLLEDAVQFLDRAETVLRERRRNVWWTTWYFERKLKAISLSVFASTARPDLPIPFLGLEAAMRETDTEADRLLKDAMRMIRVDSYRMATIVEAYSSCVTALVYRLANNSKSPRLPIRVNYMLRNLDDAVAHLKLIHGRRSNPQPRTGDPTVLKEDMDVEVARYVGQVLERHRIWLKSGTFLDLLDKAQGHD